MPWRSQSLERALTREVFDVLPFRAPSVALCATSMTTGPPSTIRMETVAMAAHRCRPDRGSMPLASALATSPPSSFAVWKPRCRHPSSRRLRPSRRSPPPRGRWSGRSCPSCRVHGAEAAALPRSPLPASGPARGHRVSWRNWRQWPQGMWETATARSADSPAAAAETQPLASSPTAPTRRPDPTRPLAPSPTAPTPPTRRPEIGTRASFQRRREVDQKEGRRRVKGRRLTLLLRRHRRRGTCRSRKGIAPPATPPTTRDLQITEGDRGSGLWCARR